LILKKLGGDMKSDIARPPTLSDDLDEILLLADRIAVIYEGKIMGVVKRNEVSVEDWVY
jgi:ABC-type proline/glycine betaine transport system ATPase subunit